MSDQVKRRLVGAGLLVLFGVGLAVFLAPFAFPTPPPIVTRFQTTAVFSPNGDGSREVARITVRLNEPSLVDVQIRDRDDREWRALIAEERPKGLVKLTWDGNDAQGAPVPDGRYLVRLRASAGRKRWNVSRGIVVDRAAPQLGTLTVDSAALSGPGEGQCRVAATALERGTVTIEAISPTGTLAEARFGPTPVTAGQTSLWNWDGKRADGGNVAPGLYAISARLKDVPGNTATATATCWVGHGIGAMVPARPALGTRAGVRLTGLDGSALAPSTRVTLEVFRRRGDPGISSQVLGPRLGARVTGPMATVRLPLPRRIPAAQLWVVATFDGGRALIPLRP